WSKTSPQQLIDNDLGRPPNIGSLAPSCAYGSGTYQPRIARTVLLAGSPASLFIHRAHLAGSLFFTRHALRLRITAINPNPDHHGTE
ncbi:hypothetical protein SB690_20250, partial [Bacillus sp. SIMBA_006]|uniref:hypothetical protein n=1 Tax=Bacillus sp. SIMBA_006 TaxID=3085755 RepID=UPI00397D66BA